MDVECIPIRQSYTINSTHRHMPVRGVVNANKNNKSLLYSVLLQVHGSSDVDLSSGGGEWIDLFFIQSQLHGDGMISQRLNLRGMRWNHYGAQISIYRCADLSSVHGYGFRYIEEL